MDGRAGSSGAVLCTPLISATIGWSIRSSCLFGRYSATVIKISRPGCGCDAWLAHARRRALLRVGSGRLRMLSLSGYRRDMSLTRHRLVFRPWTRADSAVATVVADVAHIVVHHAGVINIVDVGDVHVVHGTVVKKVSAVPTPAFVTLTEIAEAVIDPAVEAYVRTPVAVIENKSVASPTPIGWSPQETDFRRHHPCARHPVVIADVVIVGPVARCPEITVPRTKRLLIDRQGGRAEPNGHADLRERCCRHREDDEREQQRTNKTDMHCDSFSPSSLVCPVLLGRSGFRGLRGANEGRNGTADCVSLANGSARTFSFRRGRNLFKKAQFRACVPF